MLKQVQHDILESMKPRLALFGTPNYSLLVFDKLRSADYPISVVVTKSPQSVGRHQQFRPTPVAGWATSHHLSLLTPLSHPDKPWLFQDETKFTKNILSFRPDLLITADYTQKIPIILIRQIKYGGINVHPSLLPSYRGPAPVPWAILNGETETGVSIVTLTEKFDQGQIVAQENEPIFPTDTTDSLLIRLFTKGAELLLRILAQYPKQLTTYNLQLTTKPSYFPRFNRDSGFEPWEKIMKAMETGENAERIERKWRALHPWPGIWTKMQVTDHRLQTTVEKRLKILKLHLQPETGSLKPLVVLDQIQLESKRLVSGSGTAQLIRQISK